MHARRDEAGERRERLRGDGAAHHGLADVPEGEAVTTTRALVPGEFVVDTDWKLGPATARGLWDAGVRGICRYVGLHGPAAGDVDAAELSMLLGLGFVVWLVQHTRKPEYNLLTEDTGATDAAAAIRCALAAGYDPSKLPPGAEAPCLALDLEGVRGSSVSHATAWSLAVGAARFRPLVYVGYASGITGAQLDALPVEPRFWCDAGPYSERPAPSRGYDLKQHMQETIAGVGIDRNDVLRGEAVYGLVAG
jgi:Domain of unknown function (DUF1906)